MDEHERLRHLTAHSVPEAIHDIQSVLDFIKEGYRFDDRDGTVILEEFELAIATLGRFTSDLKSYFSKPRV